MDKICTICSKPKKLEKFCIVRKNKDGRHHICNSCRSETRRDEYKENPQYYIDQNRAWKFRNRNSWILKHVKKSAKQRGLDFDLTHEDIVIPEFCPVFRTRLEFGIGRRSYNSPSVDRIDTTKGYVKGNIQIISWRANDLKRDATLPELKALVEFWEGK